MKRKWSEVSSSMMSPRVTFPFIRIVVVLAFALSSSIPFLPMSGKEKGPHKANMLKREFHCGNGFEELSIMTHLFL